MSVYLSVYLSVCLCLSCLCRYMPVSMCVCTNVCCVLCVVYVCVYVPVCVCMCVYVCFMCTERLQKVKELSGTVDGFEDADLTKEVQDRVTSHHIMSTHVTSASDASGAMYYALVRPGGT